MVETTGSLICSKHFEMSDFVYDTNDTNNRRKRKLQKEKTKYRQVKNGAYPTKFTNCPSKLSKKNYLSKKKPVETPSLGSSDAKRFQLKDQIVNSWNATLLLFHFPGAMQHNFVSKLHAHSLEQKQLPKELKPTHHT